MRVGRFITALFLLLFPIAFGVSQKTMDIEEVRRLLLYFEIESGADFTPNQRTLLYESLIASLSNASQRVALLENPETDIPADDQGKSAVATDLGADSWLHVVVGGDLEEVSVQARCLDLINGITAFELDLDKELIRGTRELGLLMWKEVGESAGAYFDRALNMENQLADLTFQALPGTRIQGISRRRLKTSEDGVATAVVALPSTIPFRATKAGYLPVEGQIYIDQPEKIVALDQQIAARIAINAYLNNMCYPGIDLLYFLVPDAVFGRIGVLTYLVGFALEDTEGNTREILTGHTLNNFNLAFGFFFNAPDRDFRFYFALAAVWRFVTTTGYWGLEPIAPFAAQPTLGWEYARNQKFKLYAEYAPYFYVAPERGLFALSLPDSDRVPFIFFPLRENIVDWAVIWELAVFNVGIRWRL
jgi:hypothetical protein